MRLDDAKSAIMAVLNLKKVDIINIFQCLGFFLIFDHHFLKDSVTFLIFFILVFCVGPDMTNLF